MAESPADTGGSGKTLQASLETEARAARAGTLHADGELARRQGDYTAARTLYQESLTISQALGDKRGIAGSLNGLGMTTLSQWDFPSARAFLEESLALYRELGNKEEIAWVLHDLGIAAQYQAEYEAAQELFAECLSLFRELGDKNGIAWALNRSGRTAREQGEHGAARALFDESLAVFRELEDERGITRCLNELGILAHAQGDRSEARTLFEESLTISRAAGARLAMRTATSLAGLAEVAHAEGNHGAARAQWMEALAIHWEQESKGGIARDLEGLAAVAVAQGQAERAARLFGVAEGLREAMGAPVPLADRAEHDRCVAAGRTTLGEASFAAAWAEGRAMTLEDAISNALSVPARGQGE